MLKIVPIRKLYTVALCAAVIGLSGCNLSQSLEDVAPSNKTSFLRGDDPQAKAGQREHPIVVAKYGGEYRHKGAERLLAIIVGRLVSVSEDKSRIYKVTVLNSPKVNAFALPGGYLYVTRGLLALANDTAELAAVIAHEMAHVSSNHAILRNDKQNSTSLGKEVVSEVLGTSVAGRVALAANQLKLADFSKDQELQADATGIRMLGQAGFDAHAAARFLETMQTHQALNSGNSNAIGGTSFLSSHPTTPQRVQIARKHARFFGAPGSGEADQDRYLKGIDGLLYGDSAEEGFVRGNRFSHLGLDVTFSTPHGAKIENQATAVVVNGPGDLATRFDAAVLPKRSSLTEYFKSGWVKNLDENSITESIQNGLSTARGTAKSGHWEFVIRLIQVNRQVYRFITAGGSGNTQIENTSNAISSSFRKMSEQERLELQPLKIKTMPVSSSDTLATLSSRMKGTNRKLRLFRVLNGLQSGEMPSLGTQVKIVTDE